MFIWTSFVDQAASQAAGDGGDVGKNPCDEGAFLFPWLTYRVPVKRHTSSKRTRWRCLCLFGLCFFLSLSSVPLAATAVILLLCGATRLICCFVAQ